LIQIFDFLSRLAFEERKRNYKQFLPVQERFSENYIIYLSFSPVLVNLASTTERKCCLSVTELNPKSNSKFTTIRLLLLFFG